MNKFLSFRNYMRNRGILSQRQFRDIHDALLECLIHSSKYYGTQDYQPASMLITQQFEYFSDQIRVIVSRNGVDIFLNNRNTIPEIKIVKQFKGNYILLDGFAYHFGQTIHETRSNIPDTILTYVRGRFYSSEEMKKVTIKPLSYRV